MSKLIQVIFAKNPGELTDRRSALGSYIFTLSEILAEKGLRMRLNQRDFGDIEVLEKNDAHASRAPLPIPKKVKAILRDGMLLNSYKSLVGDLENLEKPNAILEFYSFGSNVGFELSKKWNVPLYLVYDAPILDEYKFFNGFKPPLWGRVNKAQLDSLRRASGIIAYSEPVKDYITDLAGLKDSGHIRIHQNIDFSRFEFDYSPKTPEPIVIGFVGSFLRWHRVDLLVKVFQRLRNEGFNTRLLLVGSGLEFPSIQEQVAKSPYEADIEMTGFQDGDDLFLYKQQMHIGVMSSSNWYGAPNKLFEYGAMGMACVAPRTPTISDIFSEDQVFMFDNHDEEGLYLALKKYLDQPELISKMGNGLQDFIKANYGREKTQFFYSNLLNWDYQATQEKDDLNEHKR